MDDTRKILVETRPVAGYRGIWYSNQPVPTEHVYKYSGGLATYCAKHIPMAVHVPDVNKTFFCYGGTLPGVNRLVHMVSFVDHETGMVPKPRMLLDKGTDDAHDNPVIAIDAEGYVWIFSSAHGVSRPAFVYKSVEPHDITRFHHVLTTNFSYPQPWFLPGGELLFLHTRYFGGRRLLSWTRGIDALLDGEVEWLAGMERGHYQVSWRHGSKVGTAFNLHPEDGGLNARTNLYYLQTTDGGKSFETVDGVTVEPPLMEPDGPWLVHDFVSEGLLVYLKDLAFDRHGNPVVLIVTSKGYEPGPRNDPRTWWVVNWDGERWQRHEITRSDSNYDTGCIHVSVDGTWMVVAPTAPGPQEGNPGGEMEMWISVDEGRTWNRRHQLTLNSRWNHTYARKPVDAAPEFLAFWADGDCRKQSESMIYYLDYQGRKVFQLPFKMQSEMESPATVRDLARDELF